MAEPMTNVLGIVSIKNRGEYNSETSYEKLNVVTYQGSSYCAKGPTQGNLPTNTDYWDLMAEKGDKGDTGDDGYTPVKGTDYYTAEDIAELESTLSDDVTSEVTEQLEDLVSATPLAASSVAEMTDTTRIYVLETDGHWYYYNSNSWVDGGVYQATEINDKSITVYKLDDLLQENFTKEYENEDLGTATTGHYKYNNNGVLGDATNAYYKYYDIALAANTFYEFSGFNSFECPAIVVYDTSDNSVVASATITDSTQRWETTHLIFKTNKSGLKACVNERTTYDPSTVPRSALLLSTLSKIKEITQNNKENYIDKLKEIEGYAMSVTADTIIPNVIKLETNQYMTINLYKISKGTKYKASSSNIYSYPGIVVLNENLEVIYKSSSENVGNNIIPVNYEFTATVNGYVALHDFDYNDKSFSHNIFIEKKENKYKSKKWTLLGDSLTDGTVNTGVKKYYSYIQDDLGINIQNLGQSGCGYKRKFQNGNTFVEQSLLVDSDADVVTIFGSFNDHNIYDTDGLGNVTDTTTNTVFGCVNTTIQNLITNRPNAKIGIILPTPWNNPSCNPYNPRTRDIEYIEGLRTIAKKYSIPVLDLFYGSSMYPWNSDFRTMFYVNSDGTHPNSEGNKRFAYQIEEFIKSLI